jgi:hypothetical protein
MEDRRTSILISDEFYHLCKINAIKFSEALRIGISLILAEKGVKEYDNKLNISRKVSLLSKELADLKQELDQVKQKILKPQSL